MLTLQERIDAFNYLNLDALIAHLSAMDWGECDAQLLVCEQEDRLFRVRWVRWTETTA